MKIFKVHYNYHGTIFGGHGTGENSMVAETVEAAKVAFLKSPIYNAHGVVIEVTNIVEEKRQPSKVFTVREGVLALVIPARKFGEWDLCLWDTGACEWAGWTAHLTEEDAIQHGTLLVSQDGNQ